MSCVDQFVDWLFVQVSLKPLETRAFSVIV
jgi:hypothetical protein